MNTLALVTEFHQMFEVDEYPFPNIDDEDLNKLRLRMLSEELNELQVAIYEHDIVEVYDALLDLQVILDGTFLTMGFGGIKDEGMAEVHRSNLSKLNVDGTPIKRADGKVLKGPNFSPPNLWPIIQKALKNAKEQQSRSVCHETGKGHAEGQGDSDLPESNETVLQDRTQTERKEVMEDRTVFAIIIQDTHSGVSCDKVLKDGKEAKLRAKMLAKRFDQFNQYQEHNYEGFFFYASYGEENCVMVFKRQVDD